MSLNPSFWTVSMLALAVHGASYQSTGAVETCSSFAQTWPNCTFFPGGINYTSLNEDYFSADSWLGPACIFTPADASGMAEAIKLLKQAKTPFAIKGGGHMPVANAANINSSGVLLTSSGITDLELSNDKSTLKVGAGNIWADVYGFLEPYNLSVVGGRSGLVGVPGFVLGGGISFFGNQYGWSSSNIVQFDCVLASGEIISATSTNDFSDLFWSLRGGGNSFAIVTAFHLETFEVSAVTIGQTTYEGDLGEKFLDYVIDFAHNGSRDSKAAIEPRWGYQLGEKSYSNIMFYDGADTSPDALVNFTQALTPVESTWEVRPSMYNWTQTADPARAALQGLRARFNVVTISANRSALQIVHDTFVQTFERDLTTANISDLIGQIVYVPITEAFIEASTVRGGDPMSLDPGLAPYLFVEESIIWSNAADDENVDSCLSAFNHNVSAQLAPFGNIASPFKYLNYADQTQDVFGGYPQQNVQKLESIRSKYDPNTVFTKLMPGGWKVSL